MAAALGLLLVAAGVARAQERLSRDEAQKYAKLFVESARNVGEAPLKAEVDADKPVAMRHENHGLMIIPAKGLTEESIKAGKDVTPVAQLWFHNLAPVVDGQAAPADRLRVATVAIDGQDHSFPVCYAGLRKKADGDWELAVYAKDKEPILRLPVKKIDEAAASDTPVDFDGKRNDNGTGEVTIKVLGKYQATLTVAPQEF
jgi:hypothetical protein